MDINLRDAARLGNQISPEAMRAICSDPRVFGLVQKIETSLEQTGTCDIQALVKEALTLMDAPLDPSVCLDPEQKDRLEEFLEHREEFANMDTASLLEEDIFVHLDQHDINQHSSFAEWTGTLRTRDGGSLSEVFADYFDAHPEEQEEPVHIHTLTILTRQYCVGSQSSVECSICLASHEGTLQDVPEENCVAMIQLECGHIFDELCILEWFKHKHSCPLCRAIVE